MSSEAGNAILMAYEVIDKFADDKGLQENGKSPQWMAEVYRLCLCGKEKQ